MFASRPLSVQRLPGVVGAVSGGLPETRWMYSVRLSRFSFAGFGFVPPADAAHRIAAAAQASAFPGRLFRLPLVTPHLFPPCFSSSKLFFVRTFSRQNFSCTPFSTDIRAGSGSGTL